MLHLALVGAAFGAGWAALTPETYGLSRNETAEETMEATFGNVLVLGFALLAAVGYAVHWLYQAVAPTF